MAIARAQLVDLSLTRWYHCVTRCVRRAFLLGEGDHNRKEWLENRVEELAGIFAVAVGGFSVIQAGRLHRPAFSPRKGIDLGGAGRDFRAAGPQRPDLASSDREAARGSIAGLFLRDQPREVAGNQRTPRCASRDQPEGLSHSMTEG
jgi:hypothetical protein